LGIKTNFGERPPLTSDHRRNDAMLRLIRNFIVLRQVWRLLKRRR
jgi:hypothetical protein